MYGSNSRRRRCMPISLLLADTVWRSLLAHLESACGQRGAAGRQNRRRGMSYSVDPEARLAQTRSLSDHSDVLPEGKSINAFAKAAADTGDAACSWQPRVCVSADGRNQSAEEVNRQRFQRCADCRHVLLRLLELYRSRRARFVVRHFADDAEREGTSYDCCDEKKESTTEESTTDERKSYRPALVAVTSRHAHAYHQTPAEMSSDAMSLPPPPVMATGASLDAMPVDILCRLLTIGQKEVAAGMPTAWLLIAGHVACVSRRLRNSVSALPLWQNVRAIGALGVFFSSEQGQWVLSVRRPALHTPVVHFAILCLSNLTLRALNKQCLFLRLSKAAARAAATYRSLVVSLASDDARCSPFRSTAVPSPGTG